jgi:hypothetical protein
MRRSNTQGSAHVIIIAVLFLALIASLGVVFYQNFIVKEAPTSDLPAEQPSSIVASVTERVAFASSIYEIDRPGDWAVLTENIDGVRADGKEMVLTSQNGKVRVSVSVIEERPQGTGCDPSSGLKVSYYKVHTTKVTKLTGAPAHVVEALSDVAGGGYKYQIGLTPDGGSTHSSVGESDCTITRIGDVADAVLGENSTVTQPSIKAIIDFPKLLGKDETVVKSMQPVKDMLATDEYRAAVKILESARKK